jgi:hypothetical protein
MNPGYDQSVRQPRIPVDNSRFPLVVQRMCKGFDDSDVERMIRQYELLFHGGSRYALLIYCDPDAPVMSARQRRRVSDWYKAHAEMVRRINVATCIVIESALVRGAMTAFNWLMEPSYNQRSVPNIHEGVNYLIDELEKASIHVPLEVFALRDVPERKLKQLA